MTPGREIGDGGKLREKREKHTESGKRQYQQTESMGGVSFPMLGDRFLYVVGGDAGVHPSVCDYEGKRKTSMRRVGEGLLYQIVI